jgi:Protein of unknown function (DUF2865)
MRLVVIKFFKALALAGLLSVAVPAPAFAQGFFEQLFGLSPKPKAMPSLALPPGQSGQPGYGGPRTPGGSVFPSRDETNGLRPKGDGANNAERGAYRTLCVRTCDGYYFPISNSTTKNNFMRDQVKCKSTCGGEARLFTTPVSMSVNPKESLDAMVDLSGLAYSRLPAAFKYRKTLVTGCQCKPEPWSDAELDRHRRYAEAEQRGKPGQVNAAVASVEVRAEPKKTADTASGSGAKVVAVATAKLATTEVSVATDDGANPAPLPSIAAKPAKRISRIANATEPSADQLQPDRAPTQRSKTSRRPVDVAWTPAPPSQPQPIAKSSGLFGGGMGLGAGGSTYAWPGDAPRR